MPRLHDARICSSMLNRRNQNSSACQFRSCDSSTWESNTFLQNESSGNITSLRVVAAMPNLWRYVQDRFFFKKSIGTASSTKSLSTSLETVNHTPTSPLQNLPAEIIDPILNHLDIVSKACLSLSSRDFRRYIQPGNSKPDSCAQWMVFCRLESDALAKGIALPKKLACAFCKKRHHHLLFSHPFSTSGCNIEQWGMLSRWPEPTTRFCWRHMSKRFCYSPTLYDRQQEINTRLLSLSKKVMEREQAYSAPFTDAELNEVNSELDEANSFSRDRWIMKREQACGHCGNQLVRDDGTGVQQCPSCVALCDTCGLLEMFVAKRYGPERHFQSAGNLYFYERWRVRSPMMIQDCHPWENDGGRYAKYTVLEYDWLR